MGIFFKPEQTPKIFDPLSVIQYGYGSCTGISITLIDALRSVGVPARLVGTPAWHGNQSLGNHNWVEIYVPGKGLNGENWTFIEGYPAGHPETLSNPCDKWFCNPSHWNGKTEAFAAKFNKTNAKTYYPMSWDESNHDVPGEDRTDFYQKVCEACPNSSTSNAVDNDQTVVV